MSSNKTIPTDGSVTAFLDTVSDEQKKADCYALVDLMGDLTGEVATLWGTSLVGFGTYHYKYESGREGDMPLTGFSPRSKEITLYIMAGFSRSDDLMERLGKHRTGKSCLYIKKLEDIDLDVLRELVQASVGYMKQKYPRFLSRPHLPPTLVLFAESGFFHLY